MADDLRIDDSDREPDLPRSLANDLARLYGETPAVPPSIDAAVALAARRRLLGIRARRRALRWAGGAAAAAAALAVAVVLSRPHAAAPSASREHSAAQADIDGNGRIDILDAFAMARGIEARSDPRRDWDLNGDGAVDAFDVDLIAMAAVNLDRGTFR